MSEYVPSEALEKARAYEQRREEYITPENRPVLHLTPRVGWMNDPNGFSYYNGAYHLFYQYNPYSTRWAPMHWGHAVSQDLLHWEFLPCALAPDAPYDDALGCFSGSAQEMPDGSHLLMYTGVAADGHHPDGSRRTRQVQCLAIGDGLNYTKLDTNPVIDGVTLPGGSSVVDFRDPKIWQREDGTYACVLASLGPDHSGQIVLYESDDALSWRFRSVVAQNHGRYGIMWECPDLFELDGKDVLLLSPQDMLSEGHRFYSGNGTLCLIGSFDQESGELLRETEEAIDHGIDFYATQTLLTPDGRRVMVAWMQNWDSTSFVEPGAPWFGQMTIPRELHVRDGHLWQWPIRELDALRTGEVVHEGVELGGGPIALEGVRGRVIDLLVDVRPADASGTYEEIVIWFAKDEKRHCSLRYRPSKGTLTMNRTHAGSRRAIVHHRKTDVAGAPANLSLRLVMDRHSVEVFVNGGEQALTMTIPTELTAEDITFFSRGKSVIDVRKYDLA